MDKKAPKPQSIATISDKEFLTNYNLNKCLSVYGGVKSIEQCLDTISPSMGVIVREKGKDFTEAFLAAWLINLNEILNLRRPMTENQIMLCVKEVISNYASIKIVDLTLLFKKIMSGEFGEFYESLSIPKVLTFFRDYWEERLDVASKRSMDKSQDYKKNDPFNISSNIKRNWNSY